jgi:hypothetical protein
MKRRKLSAQQVGLVHGFRSGLEEQIAQQLKTLGIAFDYESVKLHYIKPARDAKYTPDFILPNGIVIESKGRFLVDDRQKHLILKSQHPGLDVRFVFSNSNTKISKNSKTSYAAWCEKHGFEYADKYIPKAWIDEPPDEGRLAALKGATCQ